MSSPSYEKAVAEKMSRVQRRTIAAIQRTDAIAEDFALDPDPDAIATLESFDPLSLANAKRLNSISLHIQNTKTFQIKLANDITDELSKSSDDDDPDEKNAFVESHLLVGNLNDTILRSRRLPNLYNRIEASPNAFISTFMSAGIGAIIGLTPDASNTLVFSTVNLFREEAMMKQILDPALRHELGGIGDSADLFRKNSHATRLLTLCSKAFGQNIVSLSVTPIVRAIVAADASFEIDPVLEKDSRVRAQNLTRLCESGLDLLRDVIADVPATFSMMCKIVNSAIEAKFPSCGWIGISNLLFLRFVCPAIACPIGVKNLTPKAKRNLVLLTKLVQSAASLHEFGDKEAFMQDANPLIVQVIPQLKAFYAMFIDQNPSHTRSRSDVKRLSRRFNAPIRSYIITRKISSLARIAEYLELLSNYPDAMALLADALRGHVRHERHRRFLVLSPLHESLFVYKERKSEQQGDRLAMPLAQYPIEKVDRVKIVGDDALELALVEPGAPIRFVFEDAGPVIKVWEDRIEEMRLLVRQMQFVMDHEASSPFITIEPGPDR